MITNLAPTKDGVKAIHELSKPYPKYDKSETDRKIKHAVKENKPHTCKYIQAYNINIWHPMYLQMIKSNIFKNILDLNAVKSAM